MMDNDFKRIILMDHYTNSYNRGLLEDERYKTVHNASESCIDDIKVQMLIEDDTIKDVRFDGVACTISTASTDIMCSLLKDKSLKEAKHIIDEYYGMIDGKEADYDLLEEAAAFDTLYKQPNRIKCGTIGINAMKEIIDNYEER